MGTLIIESPLEVEHNITNISITEKHIIYSIKYFLAIDIKSKGNVDIYPLIDRDTIEGIHSKKRMIVTLKLFFSLI